MKKVEYKKGSHSKYLLRYHFVMCTKYGHKILTGEIEAEIKKILEDISKVEEYEIDIMETDIDHIHLLIESKPRLLLRQIRQNIYNLFIVLY